MSPDVPNSLSLCLIEKRRWCAKRTVLEEKCYFLPFVWSHNKTRISNSMNRNPISAGGGVRTWTETMLTSDSENGLWWSLDGDIPGRRVSGDEVQPFERNPSNGCIWTDGDDNSHACRILIESWCSSFLKLLRVISVALNQEGGLLNLLKKKTDGGVGALRGQIQSQ